MYEEIEKIYQKENEYIKEERFSNKVMIGSSIILIILYIFIYKVTDKKLISIAISFFITIGLLTIIVYLFKNKILSFFEKRYRIKKLKFDFKNKSKNPNLNIIIKEKEIKLFTNYLIKNKLYKKENIKCIIEHYRENAIISKEQEKTNYVFNVLISIIIPTTLAFTTPEGILNVKPFINFLILALYTRALILIAKYIMHTLFNYKSKSEMYRRLEEIFTEIYNNINILTFIKEKTAKNS